MQGEDNLNVEPKNKMLSKAFVVINEERIDPNLFKERQLICKRETSAKGSKRRGYIITRTTSAIALQSRSETPQTSNSLSDSNI